MGCQHSAVSCQLPALVKHHPTNNLRTAASGLTA